jgi:hypothetical protein
VLGIFYSSNSVFGCKMASRNLFLIGLSDLWRKIGLIA